MSSQLKLPELKRRRIAAGKAQSSSSVPSSSSSVHATKMTTCKTPAMKCSLDVKTTPAVVSANAPSQHKRNRDLLKAPSSAALAAVDNSSFVNANVAAAFDGQEDLSMGMSSPQPRPLTATQKVTPSPTIAAAPAIQQQRSATSFLYASKKNDDISMITHVTPYSGTSHDLLKLHGFDPSQTVTILKRHPKATVKSVHGRNESVYNFVPQSSDDPLPDGFVKTMPATFAKKANQVFITLDLHGNGLVDPVECANHEICGLYASTSIAVPPSESKGPGMHPLTHCDGCAMDLDPNATWLKRPASCLCGAEKFDNCKVCRSCRTKMPCKNCFATTGVHPITRLCLESCYQESKRSYYEARHREELCVRCGINPLAGDRKGSRRTADQCSACRELCAHYTERDGEKEWCTNKKKGTNNETLCLSHCREAKYEYQKVYRAKRKANGGAPVSVLGNKAKFTEKDVRDLVTAVDNAKKKPFGETERVASWAEVATQYNKGRPIEKQLKPRQLSDKYLSYKKSLREK
eukprot:scaffold13398_cov84-Skeletonema_dohrnii-CCMP3373.AAC.1